MEKHPINSNHFTSDELLIQLGNQIRALRIRRNINQITLAEHAGIGVTALKNLETGKGATLTTLIQTLRALDRSEWLKTLAPTVSISPLQMLKTKHQRTRASKPRSLRNKI